MKYSKSIVKDLDKKLCDFRSTHFSKLRVPRNNQCSVRHLQNIKENKSILKLKTEKEEASSNKSVP